MRGGKSLGKIMDKSQQAKRAKGRGPKAVGPLPSSFCSLRFISAPLILAVCSDGQICSALDVAAFSRKAESGSWAGLPGVVAIPHSARAASEENTAPDSGVEPVLAVLHVLLALILPSVW